MKKYIIKSIILSVLVGFSGYSLQASADDLDASQPAGQQTVHNEKSFSPRAYCHAGDGSVTETIQNDIYLCCYEAQHKCLAIDTNKFMSWVVDYGAKDTGNLDLSLGNNHAY